MFGWKSTISAKSDIGWTVVGGTSDGGTVSNEERADMYRIRTTFSGMSGAPWISTAYFEEGAGTAAQANTAVGVFWSTVDGLMDSEVDWTTSGEVETVNENTGNVTAVQGVTAATGSGALAVEALPIATQGLVRWRTGIYIAGREIRGRWFIPGLTETANDNGAPSAATVTAINAAATALIADANSAIGVWSRKVGQFAPATSSSMWTTFAVLRSRRD